MSKASKILLVLIFISYTNVFAQQVKNCVPGKKIYKIDSLPIIPNTLKIISKHVLPHYFVDIKNSTIIFDDTVRESFSIEYQRLPINIFKKIKLFDSTQIVPGFGKSFLPSEENYGEIITDNENIKTEGVISRYVSIGNTQSLVMGSNLNLKLQGKLADGMHIEAYITDNSIPVNPEGTTINITDLTKAYIKAYDNTHTFKAGDINFISKNSNFIRYNKQVKGLSYKIKDSSTIYKAGFSIAKGKYVRKKFQGEEGNQGPYRLQGANGETFVIIVAGSERVYVDGKLKKRGRNNDYIIDYDKAEITFTAKCPINSQSRIIVEFQYAQKFYPEFFDYATINSRFKNFEVKAGFYTSYDAKNQSIEPLTDKEKLFLASLPDTSTKIFYPSYRIDSTAKIRYKKIDTIINGKVYKNILVYSTDKEAIYTASFAYVGENNGNYIIDASGLNGTIYKWIAPKNGQKQGNYEPVFILQTPKSKKIFSLGTKWHNKNITFLYEGDLSLNNTNTFTPKTLKGIAQKATIKYNVHKWQFLASYSFISQNFKAFETFRSIEFARDWNLLTKHNANEKNRNFSVLNKSALGYIRLTTSFLNYYKNYSGLKTYFLLRDTIHLWRKTYHFSLLKTNQILLNTTFIRSNITNVLYTNKMIFGAEYENEINVIKKYNTIDTNSFMFHRFGLFLQNKDTNRYLLNLKVFRRYNYLSDTTFYQQSVSNNFILESKIKGKKLKTNIIAGYRKFTAIDSSNIPSLWAQEKINFFYKGLIFNMFYIQQQGQQPKEKFIFLKVEPRKGQYQWIDYNHDGKQQINEFEIAKFADKAEYIKVPVQTNKSEKIYLYRINGSFNIIPYLFFKKTKKLKSLKNIFSFNLDKKLTSLNIFDNKIVAQRSYLINRLNFKILKNLSFEWKYNSSTQIENTFIGQQSNINKFNSAIFSYFYKNLAIISIKLSTGKNISKSETFEASNFTIAEKSSQIQSSINLKPHTLIFSYNFKYKTAEDTSLRAKIHNIDFKWQTYMQSIQTEVNLNFIYNDLNATKENPLIYNLLEGYKPGINFLINIKLSKNILQNLHITFSYSGRIENNRLIHSGLVNISSLF